MIKSHAIRYIALAESQLNSLIKEIMDFDVSLFYFFLGVRKQPSSFLFKELRIVLNFGTVKSKLT
jgi:hypothetical protein